MNNAAQNIQADKLLSESDPAPFEIINPQSLYPVLLVCEHAGQCIPARLNGLGISQEQLNLHIGWDIGAEKLTRAMAEALGAPAILQRYSRLVIDCNRPPEAHDSSPETSDGIQIPGNFNLDAHARRARQNEIFDPYHAAIAAHAERNPPRLLLSIHSFTPSMGGQDRHMEIGFLFRADVETSRYLGQYVQALRPKITIGMNEPYQIDDESDWFVPRHGEARGIPHSLIEIRNDQINTDEGVAKWAKVLTAAIEQYLKEN